VAISSTATDQVTIYGWSPSTSAALKAWLAERAGALTDPLFPTTTSKPLSRDAIERRLAIHLARASTSCDSLMNAA
jgi:integrase/recombinase XerD